MKGYQFLLLLILLCLLPVWGHAEADASREWVVSPSGAGDFVTLTEALAHAQNGDRICLTAGVYAQPKEAYPLTIDKSVAIYAREGDEVILDCPGFETMLNIHAEDVSIQGIRVHLRKWAIVARGDRLSIRNCEFTLIDTAFRRSSCAVWLSGVKQVQIVDCCFEGCSVSIVGPPVTQGSTAPALTAMFEVGEDIEYFTTHEIRNCTVNGRPLYYFVGEDDLTLPTDAGEVIAVQCNGVTAENMDVSDSSMGLVLAYCQNVRLINCRADRCGIFGIYLAYVEDGLLEDCETVDTNHGMDFRAVKRIQVLRCRATHCDQGIFFSYGDDCLIVDCEAENCGRGFFFACGNRCQVVRCIARYNENGFSPQKENHILFLDNISQGNTVAGFRLERTSAICIGNQFLEDWVGVIAYNYGDNAISLYDNVFSDCGSCGLYMRDIAGGHVSGNRFEDNAKCVMELAGSLGDMLFDTNDYGDGAILNQSDIENGAVQ
ncbi:MAG: right-handed parallel beta-helix repeat-containing protein [Clostridia bacterium]|nr:right-handed parallel beta-helix repeat-containing protein [Clostridia bacterium]